jgi:hypothetical protein
MKVSRLLLAGAMLTIAIPVCAQSLGDLAKKEAERRKATPQPTKVYTDEDLKKITVPGDTVPPPADNKDTKDPKDAKDQDAKAQDAKEPGAKDKDAPAAHDETWWRARITAAQEDVRRGEAFRDALQSQINGLTADFSSRDDPAQRAVIGDNRQKALAELDKVNADIEKAKKHIGDIEEEARRANVPPGWLR